MRVAALAGGVGAGKFLRGLVRVVRPEDVTVVVNTADDITLHGLHVSPDIDSVTYWLAGIADRERGWGRDGETFRSFEELRRLDPERGWFALGDLDLALHQMRTGFLAEGWTLSEVTASVAVAFGLGTRIVPMSNDPVTTRIVTAGGADLHLQEYWVRLGAKPPVAAVRLQGVEDARPAPGVLETIAAAEVVVICPSNPVVSIAPIFAVAGIREAVEARRPRVVGISPIVGGAPVRGMADRLMPAVGLEVSAFGAALAYEGLLGGWVIDEADRALASRIEGLGSKVAVTDTIMSGDDAAERLAGVALDLVA